MANVESGLRTAARTAANIASAAGDRVLGHIVELKDPGNSSCRRSLNGAAALVLTVVPVVPLLTVHAALEIGVFALEKTRIIKPSSST